MVEFSDFHHCYFFLCSLKVGSELNGMVMKIKLGAGEKNKSEDLT